MRPGIRSLSSTTNFYLSFCGYAPSCNMATESEATTLDKETEVTSFPAASSAGAEKVRCSSVNELKRKRYKHNQGDLAKKRLRVVKTMDKARLSNGTPSKVEGIRGQIDTVELPVRPEFILKDGLRHIRPYFFNYTAWSKRRWVGRNLVDVLVQEFFPSADGQFELYINDLKRLRINGQPVTSDHVFKDNELMEHVVHRHECPVVDQEIAVIFNTDDMLVVDKPCSIPVHPTGRYRHNSVCMLLKWIYGFQDNELRVMHRLDRLTSGVLMFAKNLKTDRRIKDLFLSHSVEKCYLARVDGEFPVEPIVCTEPISLLCEKIGISFVPTSKEDRENARVCETRFERDSYNGKTSVVRCYPKTGRTHQIRIHLQWLGFPISNDYLYNCSSFGPKKGKGSEYGKSREQLAQDVRDQHRRLIDDEYEGVVDTASVMKEMKARFAAKGMNVDGEPEFYDPYCFRCKLNYTEPSREDLTMYLHCWKYDVAEYHFEAPRPKWAEPDFGADLQ